jgi:hypothetical protein
MKEVTGSLWVFPADIRVITTNGFTKKNGEAVMGRGCALEAAKRYPDFPKLLGEMLRKVGNIPHNFYFSERSEEIWTFPVKHAWYEKADLRLIEASAKYFADYFSHPEHADTRIVIPRPGCGNGQLRWEDVKPVLEPLLDDRFHVITFR